VASLDSRNGHSMSHRLVLALTAFLLASQASAQPPDIKFTGVFTGPAQLRHYSPHAKLEESRVNDAIVIKIEPDGAIKGKTRDSKCMITGMTSPPVGANVLTIDMELQFTGCTGFPYMNGSHLGSLNVMSGALLEIRTTVLTIGSVQAITSLDANLSRPGPAKPKKFLGN